MYDIMIVIIRSACIIVVGRRGLSEDALMSSTLKPVWQDVVFTLQVHFNRSRRQATSWRCLSCHIYVKYQGLGWVGGICALTRARAPGI